LNIRKEFFVSHIIGLSLLLMWSLGLLGPYTITGFIEVLLITVLLNLLIRKINRRIYSRLSYIKDWVSININ
jgi:hypothetical protein